MTPAQQAALEALAGRPIGAGEVLLAQARADGDLAAAISVGRSRLHPRLVSERGVLEALGPIEGDVVLTALESITSADVLPESARPYYGAIRRGVAWLKGDGLDMGSPTTRQMLDLLAAVGLVGAASAATLKALGTTPDPVSADQVSAILNRED